MLERYKHIITKLSEARAKGDTAQTKQWRIKLQAWQNEYGASAPIQ